MLNVPIPNIIADALKPFHFKFFSRPRLNILSLALSKFIPSSPSIGLDIGCGSGELAKNISLLTPQTRFTCIDTLPRLTHEAECCLDFKTYNGRDLPYPDKSFSFSMLIDVLHHTDNPKQLLAEARRVSRDFILVKDHICHSQYDNFILTIMDWIGNKSYGVNLPYNYLTAAQWRELFKELKLEVEERITNIGLYQAPVSFIFERNLHFIAKLKIEK